MSQKIINKIIANTITLTADPKTELIIEPELVNKVIEAIQKGKELEKNQVKPRPKDPIKKVFFNYAKNTTTVLWNDGTNTTVHCAEDESFDEEKAIALCFMKKVFNNRGCYNEILKKWVIEGEIQ